MTGGDNNIFTQISFLVLAALACKNAILIVEFARQEENAGRGRIEAILDACRVRLRPVLMTSIAFIMGVVPLVLSEGAGAEMRRTLGTAVFGGMLGVTLFGIFLTPVFYYVIEWTGDTWRGRSAFLVGLGAWIPRRGARLAAAAPKANSRSRLPKHPPTDFDST